MNKSCHSYGASLVIWDHTYSVTYHPTQVNTSRLNHSQMCSLVSGGSEHIWLWLRRDVFTCVGWKVTLYVWSHMTSLTPSTRHKWTHPALTPAR